MGERREGPVRPVGGQESECSGPRGNVARPRRPSISGAFPINSRPRGVSADPGPLQFPWAQMFLLRPVSLPKWAKDPVAGGIIGDVWAGQMSTSDKSSSLNSLEKISESGKETSVPISRCSLAITSCWILLNSPTSHTEPHPQTMWKRNLIFTPLPWKPAFGLRAGFFLPSRGQGGCHGREADLQPLPPLSSAECLAPGPASVLAVFQGRARA